jgi:hypothetical protein
LIDLAFWVGMIVAVKPALPEGAKHVALYVVYLRNGYFLRRALLVLFPASFEWQAHRSSVFAWQAHRSSVCAASPALLRF